MQEIIYCRWSPTLGELESDALSVWGTPEYEGDRNNSTVFFGLYGLPDFYTLWRHKGKKYILWAGSDITNFINGYWLDKEGKIKLELGKWEISRWINEYCESWVENQVEHDALKEIGIESKVCPSFLGNVNDFEYSYRHSETPSVYTSVSGDNFELYGWDKIPELAALNLDIKFHLYGNIGSPPYVFTQNVIFHGRVPKEQMNEEIKKMQGALRLTEFDGASEIIVKAMLWGQYAFSLIEYPFVDKVSSLSLLKYRESPNIKGREWWVKNLNQFPWNK